MDARLQTLTDTARAFGGDQYHSILLWGDDAWGALEASGAAFGATLYRRPDCAYVIESLTLIESLEWRRENATITCQRSRDATADEVAEARERGMNAHRQAHDFATIGGAS